MAFSDRPLEHIVSMEHMQTQGEEKNEEVASVLENSADPNSSKKSLATGVGLAVALVLLIGFGGVVRGVRAGSEHPFIVSSARFLNISVASINGFKVKYADYITDLQAFRTQNAKEGGPLTPEAISDKALNRLLVNRLVDSIAVNRGVSVTEADIKLAKETIVSQYSDAEVAEAELQSTFGWNFDTFVERVMVPSLLQQKLAVHMATVEVIAEDPYAVEQSHAGNILFPVKNVKEKEKVRAQAQKVLNRIKAGEDFATLAKEFGTEATKDKGGDLGWVARGTFAPEFEVALSTLQPGALHQTLVETQFGFHIVKLEERRYVIDFAKFMDVELDKASIEIFGNIHNPFQAPPAS